MNKKILSSTIAMILSYSAIADTTYFTVINPVEDKKGYLTTPTIGLNPLLIEEGDSLKTINIPLTLSDELPTNGSINYTISHISTNNDDLEIQTGVINLNKTDSSYLIPVEIKGGYLIESDEVFNVTLSNPSFLILSGLYSSRNYTITDNDTTPNISIQDLSVMESNTDFISNLVVSLSRPSGIPFTVDYTTSIDTAKVEDFVIETGTISFEADLLSKTLPVTIKGDLIDEYEETFKVTLSNPTFVTLDKSIATVSIQDNDESPTLSISDNSYLEGGFNRRRIDKCIFIIRIWNINYTCGFFKCWYWR